MSATLGFLSQLSSAGLEKVDLIKASEKRRGGRRTAEVEIVALEMVGHVGGAGHGGGLSIYIIYMRSPHVPHVSYAVRFLFQFCIHFCNRILHNFFILLLSWHCRHLHLELQKLFRSRQQMSS